MDVELIQISVEIVRVASDREPSLRGITGARVILRDQSGRVLPHCGLKMDADPKDGLGFVTVKVPVHGIRELDE